MGEQYGRQRPFNYVGAQCHGHLSGLGNVVSQLDTGSIYKKNNCGHFWVPFSKKWDPAGFIGLVRQGASRIKERLDVAGPRSKGGVASGEELSWGVFTGKPASFGVPPT